MATRSKATQKSSSPINENIAVNEATGAILEKTTPSIRDVLSKISDDLVVSVESRFYGQLIYKNHRTGDEYEWDNASDIQELTVADLKEMKSRQVGFFKNQWVCVVAVDDDEVTPSDILKKLNLDKYYLNIIEIKNTKEVCSWSEYEIGKKVSLLSQGAKANLVIALNDYIQSGKLDSVKCIKAFEKALGCELSLPE